MAEQNQTVSTEGELISEKAVLRLMNYIKAEAKGKSYTLPAASDSTLGGVKIGEGINISEDGTISVPNSGGSSAPTELNADKVNIDETHTLADKVTDWDNKVDKVTGKDLSSNDFTNDYKEKIDGLSNYDDTALSGRVTSLEDLVPETASSSNKLATLADIPAGGSGTGTGGTTNYPDLTNKPKIAGVELVGDKSLVDLGIQPAEEGKGLSVENYTTEEKNKLSSLSNYDDTALAGRITNIEDIIPSTATTENKLATLADIPESGSSVPEGGTTGQVLTKKSDTDGDVEWKDFPKFTAADIDRIWGSSLEDGDDGKY